MLFGEDDPIGSTVRIGTLTVTIVGVLQPRGNSTTGQDQDDTIFLPYTTAMHYLKGSTAYVDDVMCSAATNEAIPGVRDAIADLLRLRHRLQEGRPDDFNLRAPEDSIRLQAETLRTTELFLSAVASISLLVGGIGVMNIMLVSVTERTREIGLRMAIGARELDVRLQFLAEAALLGVLGGIAGVSNRHRSVQRDRERVRLADGVVDANRVFVGRIRLRRRDRVRLLSREKRLGDGSDRSVTARVDAS